MTDRARRTTTTVLRDAEGDARYAQLDQLAFRYWAFSRCVIRRIAITVSD